MMPASREPTFTPPRRARMCLCVALVDVEGVELRVCF
jgi:hypothetical protein